MELDNILYNKITHLTNSGNDFADLEEYEQAINKYLAALKLVPDPKKDWEASTWIYASLGDCSYLNKDYKNAINYLYEALNCPKGIENPFIYLRLGESWFEMEELNKAKEYLLKAYMLGGSEIYDEEEDKYVNFVRKII